MILGSSAFLGLALGNRSIACAEVSVRGDRKSVRRTALFTLPQELAFEGPPIAKQRDWGPRQSDALGQALARFLRQQRFRASRAIVGVPARWLLAVERDVPPTDQEQLRSILQLHAERLATPEAGEMVFDYAEAPKRTGSRLGTPGVEPSDARPTAHDSQRSVLLVGILRQQLEQIEHVLDAAGIRVAAVTSTSLVLAGSLQDPSDQPLLMMGQQDVEMVWQRGGSPRLLRHIAVPSMNGHGGPALGPLGSELRRTIALMPVPMAIGSRDQATDDRPTRELLLWDGIGLSEQQILELSARLGASVRKIAGLRHDGAASAAQAGDNWGPRPQGEAGADVVDLEAFAPALALASAGAEGAQRGISRLASPRRSAAGRTERLLLPVDFKHSRLVQPRKRQLNRRMAGLILMAAIAVLGAASLVWGLRQRQADLRTMQLQIDSMAEDVKSAERMLDQVAYAGGYSPAANDVIAGVGTRPATLDCLREITLAFRDDDPIWVTGLTLRESAKGQTAGKTSDVMTMPGQLVGKAVDQKTILTLADRLSGNRRFNDVHAMQITEVNAPGGRSKEQSFTITFTFLGKE